MPCLHIVDYDYVVLVHDIIKVNSIFKNMYNCKQFGTIYCMCTRIVSKYKK